MNSFLKKSFVAIGAVACLGGQIAYSDTDPNVVPLVGGISILDAKSQTGPDGKIRVLFDLNPSTTYSGSTLWILDNLGNFLAAGTPNIPASVGFDSTDKSHILVQGQKDGNTTLVFLFTPFILTAPSQITAFGVWTYNSAGQLIAAASYGPFTGTVIQDVRFSPTGDFTVVWTNQSSSIGYGGAIGTVIAWTLNEFGSVVSTAGPFGPFGNTFLGKVDLDQNNLQHWFWKSTSSGQSTVAIWSLNASGNIVNASSFGPF
jgi:hypothetical protein